MWIGTCRQTVFLVMWVGTMVSAMTVSQETFKLRILHTNDMHSRFQQVSRSAGKCSDQEMKANQCYGGFARLRTALRQEMDKAKEEKIELLVLNAGDNYQGTVWYSILKWTVVLHFLNLLPFDVITLGNHEFDDKIDGLIPYLDGVKMPVIAANLDYTNVPELGRTPLKKHIVLERGGHKIGIIGYVTPETVVTSSPGKLMFLDEIETLKKEAEKMHNDGISIIIGLGHSGLDKDLEIAKNVPYLDVIVGGHSHTFLYTGKPPDSDVPVREYPIKVKQDSGRIVLVTQAYAFTKYLGKFDVTFDDKGEVIDGTGNPILLDAKIPEDPEVLKDLTDWEKLLNETLQREIGLTTVVLDAQNCRFGECNMGNLMADAYIYHVVKNRTKPHWTGAAIALQQGGGVRATINVTMSNGVIIEEDVITTMPFYGTVSMVKLKGKALKSALEWSVARYDTVFRRVGRGEFLQVSGLRVTYNLKKPSGSRVVSVRVRCANCSVPEYHDLDLNADYNVLMPTFLYRGGDNHTALKTGTEVYQFNMLDTDMVIDYINKTSLVYTGVEDRILFTSAGSSLKINSIYLSIFISLLIVK